MLSVSLWLRVLTVGGEKSACCPDVLASGGSDGGSDTVVVEVVAEVLHGVDVNLLEWHVGYLVPSDEVDSAVEAVEQMG